MAIKGILKFINSANEEAPDLVITKSTFLEQTLVSLDFFKQTLVYLLLPDG